MGVGVIVSVLKRNARELFFSRPSLFLVLFFGVVVVVVVLASS